MSSFVENNRYDPATGCWNWTGSKGPHGYGQKFFQGRLHAVHRLAAHFYLRFDLNSPLRILHRCDNPSCFNPKHLFIGTQLDNIRDCIRKGRFFNQKREGSSTTCPLGHPYSGSNLFLRSSGAKECRICRADSRKRYKLRMKKG